jgi:hypothetical protein
MTLFKAVNVREGVSTYTLPDINTLKNAIRQELRMLRRTLYVASWHTWEVAAMS